ncbi:MAG: hypothetical protein HRT47_06195 [Candidatus Caenarcaniphilales bacterium]|nr:hypothetical protein [Candidatus Caenarcaniphilales bacterium]
MIKKNDQSFGDFKRRKHHRRKIQEAAKKIIEVRETAQKPDITNIKESKEQKRLKLHRVHIKQCHNFNQSPNFKKYLETVYKDSDNANIKRSITKLKNKLPKLFKPDNSEESFELDYILKLQYKNIRILGQDEHKNQITKSEMSLIFNFITNLVHTQKVAINKIKASNLYKSFDKASNEEADLPGGKFKYQDSWNTFKNSIWLLEDRQSRGYL